MAWWKPLAVLDKPKKGRSPMKSWPFHRASSFLVPMGIFTFAYPYLSTIFGLRQRSSLPFQSHASSSWAVENEIPVTSHYHIKLRRSRHLHSSFLIPLKETLIKSLSDFTLEFLCIARNNLTRIASYLRKAMTMLCIKILVKADSAI